MTYDDPLDDEPWERTGVGSVDDMREPLFDGDAGWLSLQARRAVVLLLKRTHLVASRNLDAWDALVAERDKVEALLNNLFLVLHLDEAAGVAYKVQAPDEAGSGFNTLLRQNPYQPNEVQVLLILRARLREAAVHGSDRVQVRGAELLDLLAPWYPEHKGDHVSARKNDRSAIARLVADEILWAEHGSRGIDVEDGVYWVSPVVEALLTPDRLAAFTDAVNEHLERRAETQDGAGTSTGGQDEIGPGTEGPDDLGVMPLLLDETDDEDGLQRAGAGSDGTCDSAVPDGRGEHDDD